MDGVKYDDENMGVALARRCSTAALLQVLIERADADGDTDATAEELAEVERLRQAMGDDVFAEPARSHAALAELGVSLLPRVVREVVARRVMAHPAPVERTPEVVLRAMLRAYEAAALEAIAAFYAADEYSGAERAAWERFISTEALANELRRDVGAAICGKFKAPAILSGLWADYEARLNGSTPLDAPPAEAP